MFYCNLRRRKKVLKTKELCNITLEEDKEELKVTKEFRSANNTKKSNHFII